MGQRVRGAEAERAEEEEWQGSVRQRTEADRKSNGSTGLGGLHANSPHPRRMPTPPILAAHCMPRPRPIYIRDAHAQP
eukprot:6177663-Pleurochrysis_carterae.AAC.2